jgi:hypothetical protein
MADAYEDLTRQIQTMMAQVEGVQTIRQNIAASDEFAKAAMTVLLADVEQKDLTSSMISVVAATAWEIADAMIEQRTKRFGITENTDNGT